MKFAAIALVAAAQASESQFPSFDSLHAHCSLTTTFNDSCHNTFAALDDTVVSFTDPASGIYAMKEVASDHYVWVTRTTPVKKYVDDIIFEVSGDGSSCTVTSKSRSQTLSYYDYDTNYCNMYNVFRNSGVTFDSPKLGDCKWVPEAADLEATCNKY